jgi:hypothetical protein
MYVRIMRPNTPHMVYTLESAICHGGHFYSISTIRDSVYGIYRTFSASGLLTNTEHTKDARLLLRRLVAFLHYIFVRRQFDPCRPAMPSPHAPDVSTFEGMIDLFMLCIVMELGHLLNPGAYRREATPELHDLVSIVYSRGLARELLDWWQACYELVGEDGTRRSGWQIFHELFSHQVRALAVYKRLAERDGIDSDEPECTAAAFITWLARFHGKQLGVTESSLSRWVAENEKKWASASFAWPGKVYTVCVRKTLIPFEPHKSPGCHEMPIQY